MRHSVGDEGAKTLSTVKQVIRSVEVDTLPLDGGSSLVVTRSENYTVSETIQGISPEMAQHQLALLNAECSSRERVAQIEATGRKEVAHQQGPATVNAMMKPVWGIMAILGAAGFYALHAHHPWVAGIAFGGMALRALFGSLIDKHDRHRDPERPN